MREFLSPDQRAIVRARADRAGVSMATILRNAVTHYLTGAVADRLLDIDDARQVAWEYGQRIKVKREKVGLSTRALADELHLSPPALNGVENGKALLNLADHQRLRAWLDS